MSPRISFARIQQVQPVLAQALIQLTDAALASGLEPSLCYLSKLRASQINGCAFCFDLNLQEAHKLDIDARKFDLLAMWRDFSAFSERERAALLWTETLTQHLNNAEIATAYTQIRPSLTEEEVVNLSAVIVAINSWNRIALGFGFTPS